jgi:hypothetical protein
MMVASATPAKTSRCQNWCGREQRTTHLVSGTQRFRIGYHADDAAPSLCVPSQRIRLGGWVLLLQGHPTRLLLFALLCGRTIDQASWQ